MTSTSYRHLLSPGRIGKMEVANRIIVTAMGVSLSEPDGSCGEQLLAYHEEQARGGAGLIIMGVSGVAWPIGAVQPNQTAISDDRFLPGLTELARRVHGHGAKIAAQLHHGGLVAGYSADTLGQEIWAPSVPVMKAGDFISYFLPEEMAMFAGQTAPTIRIMDQANIDIVVVQFADAAARAQAAGFDGVEIHSGHGYLLSSFISPATNTRTDDYGGSLPNRLRLLLEVIAAIRVRVGPDFAVWCKLDSREIGRDRGIALADAIAAAELVEAAGVDAITVTAYHDTAIGKLHSASNIPHDPDSNVPAAAAIKTRVGVPVIASGRVHVADGDRHIAAGKYDFLAMGRQLLADPALPRKLRAGTPAQVRPCIYCYTCVSSAYAREQVRCAVNPATGFEYLGVPSSTGKRYVVIGGGPGGMEAACRLADAGNQVTLFERSGRLGGTLRFAALAYPPNQRLLEWLVARTARSSVDVRLNSAPTTAMLKAIDPAAIVVASGARRTMPDLPGSDLPHVFSGDDLRAMLMGERSDELVRKTGLVTRTATRIGAATGLTGRIDFVRAVSRHWMPLGRDIVVLGGELVGLELAEFLHERGRRVTVVEPTSRLGRGLTLVRRMRLVAELREHGVAMHAGASAIAIERDAVRFIGEDGASHAIHADNVVVAMGATSDPSVADRLSEDGFTIAKVGDCTGVSYIEGAIRGGAEAAATLMA